jgi:prepilin-type N-terminal cleavage/methylation domain-containing protein
MINNFKNHQGYTLIEVLVSIALIGIVAISIMGLFTTSLQNNNASKVVIESTVLAKNIMENVKSEFTLLPSEHRDIDNLENKAIEIQNLYANSNITISTTDIDRLYIIEVEVPGIREGSVERFVSQMHLP